MQLEVIKLSLS